MTINAATASCEEVDRWLAERVCRWKWNGYYWLEDKDNVVHGAAWNPTGDRNHLSQVLEHLPTKCWPVIVRDIAGDAICDTLPFEAGFKAGWWSLPELVCRSIVHAMQEKS